MSESPGFDFAEYFDLAQHYATGGMTATARDCRVCGQPIGMVYAGLPPTTDGHEPCRAVLRQWQLQVYGLRQDPAYAAAWRAADDAWRSALAALDGPADWFKQRQSSPLLGGGR